ncbi:hypothetical protein F5984_07640 [Rudanella paleaurantiibacter]|uniref:Uncharacterized protein n=1 Tax=Rudanella paleaurantiibacter TaxID=2614655 RepID=A0A7J5U2Q4_9BACT|nr:hypothetical protein [Rudanella paleaurantiibacter]KAB7732077.1 hypothetical protein F5984_07640 [Rudanella paleaurantiibacter]
MKIYLLVFLLLCAEAKAQSGTSGTPARITFLLKNTLGYHRMFLVEGPGIKYGFTMSRRETIPCNWPVGSRLYFSQDGEAKQDLILTVTRTDEGKTLFTDVASTSRRSTEPRPSVVNADRVTFRLHNPSVIPRKIALISYEPGATGNGTTIFTLPPLIGFKSFSFPVGTRLYLADSEQVNTVMSGKRIDAGKPFLTVEKEDAGQVFDVK